jgi:hypothetical protein
MAGRFQSPDPANAGADPSNPQSWNGYSYVYNNPLSYTDPSGMFVCVSCDVDETGNPVAIGIAAAIDIGELLAGLFLGGGPPPSIAPSLATPSSPILQPSPDFDSQGWNEQIPQGDPDGLYDPGSLWNERVPIGGGFGGAFGGGSLASSIGIQMPNPWILSAVDPNVQIQSWYGRLLEHLEKIELTPDSPAVPHWRGEVRNFARQIMNKAEQVTKGRRAGALEKYLERLGITAEDLSQYLRTPIIFIDTCQMAPDQPGCLLRRSPGPIY